MAKEILLYSGIYNFVAEEIIQAIEENMGKSITLRVNSPGGDVFANWGIIAKMQEHGDVTVKVDGAAFSGAFNLMLYAKDAQALDVSTFMAHRADMYVQTPEEQAFLNKVNADLRKKMEAKVDNVKLKELKNVTIEEIFDPEKRINVYFTPKEMKALGLISKVNKVEPSEIKAMHEMFRIAAEHKPEISNPTNMTLEKLKAEHPTVYAAVVAEVSENVKKAVLKSEQTRVNAWLAYVNIDAVAALKGIKEGTEVDAAVMAEMQVKAFSKVGIKNAEADSALEVVTPASDAPVAPKAEVKKDKELSDFVAQAKALALGVEFKPKAEAAKVVA